MSATGLEIDFFQVREQEGQSDLQLEMLDLGERFLAEFKYNTDLFDLDTIQKIAGHFRVLLEGITANPEQKINELPLLTGQEKY